MAAPQRRHKTSSADVDADVAAEAADPLAAGVEERERRPLRLSRGTFLILARTFCADLTLFMTLSFVRAILETPQKYYE